MRVLAWPAFKTRYKNPYNWLLYTHMQSPHTQVDEFSFRQVLHQRYDICHLHWPVETITRHPNPLGAWARAFWMLRVLDWLRSRHTKIVWTIHDTIPHSIVHPRIAQWFEKQLIRRVDGYISLCKSNSLDSAQRNSSSTKTPHIIIPHGHYRDAYPQDWSAAAAKKDLGIPIEEPVILFFGYIDYYKNVPALIQVFKSLAATSGHLVIAGKIEAAPLKAEIMTLAAGCDRIHLHLEFVPDERLQVYFKAADLVVLPFKEILNSGSALLALSFDRPLLVPDKGALSGLQQLVGQDWMQLYQGDFSAAVLAAALAWANAPGRPASPDLSKLDWSHISQQTLLFYQSIAEG